MTLKKPLTPFLFVLSLFTFTSCGGGGGLGTDMPAKPRMVPRENTSRDSLVSGQYLAVFKPLNEATAGRISGAFTFSRDIENDEMVGDVRLAGGAPEIIHSQSVREGRRCPDIQDDLNQDGFIDINEAEKVFGRIFIPLDGDLNSQSSHDGEYPMADEYGGYIYSEIASFKSFMEDLRGPAEHPEEYAKLKANEPFHIEGRAVVVMGVADTANLPWSVSTTGRLTNYQSLPIACGVIKKVITPPGTIEL